MRLEMDSKLPMRLGFALPKVQNQTWSLLAKQLRSQL